MSESNGNYESVEIQEWRDSIRDVMELSGADHTRAIIEAIDEEALKEGVEKTFPLNTPFINTIPPEKQPPFPGSREIERRLKSIIRWNAMAMVVRANGVGKPAGIGGHISSYASSATLYEVGFNHFWRAPSDDHPGDLIFYQGHTSPGMYSRAYLQGQLDENKLKNFRRELADGGGLCSYPHPWLMPDFWQFPTVSMGLGPIMAIYQARFIKYLENRGLKKPSDQKVWAFLGDGETDEPESLAPINIAGRENLDNLIFVINCNLQRLDGPVRGNGQIVQELEARFRANRWNVIKCLWGSSWDDLLERDTSGKLVQRFGEVVDGQFQKYSTASGAYIREHFFGKYPETAALVENMSDEELTQLKRGGHDPDKVYAAYKAATESNGQPTVVIAMTVKGYGLGEIGEGRNIAHNKKVMNEQELMEFRTRFGIPISDKDVAEAPFYMPSEDSVEMKYLREHRAKLGGNLPQRRVSTDPITLPDSKIWKILDKGSDGKEASTTAAFGQILGRLLKDKEMGKLVVPIIPDESRTFGLESLFASCGIYASGGQLYEPVDKDVLMYYKESKEGQLLQEGINEAGAMSSFIAAGCSYSLHELNMVPFYIYYSMFGFQRVMDLIWAGADSRTKGFLIGGTAGRTSLNGEGLQHEDGHSHVMAAAVPNCIAYDPAFGYEISVIIEDGIKRMYVDDENVFYYITVENDPYVQPARPDHVENEPLLKGCYKYRDSLDGEAPLANLLGSGAIMNSVVKAQETLKDYGIPTAAWSVTSYKNLHDDALDCDRWNMLHPDDKRVPYVASCWDNDADVFISSSDYMKILSDALARWIPGSLQSLGTNGFGRSESREALRDHFEVDYRYITLATISQLAQKGKADPALVAQVIKDLEIDVDKLNPLTA